MDEVAQEATAATATAATATSKKPLFRSARIIPKLGERPPEAKEQPGEGDGVVEVKSNLKPDDLRADIGPPVPEEEEEKIEVAASVSKPRPHLRRHSEDEDAQPPPTAVRIPYPSKSVKLPVEATAPRHRPVEYEQPAAPGAYDAPPPPDFQRPGPIRVETPKIGGSKAKGDPIVNAIEEAFAGFGPEEDVVDVRLEVFDETTHQYWFCGQALYQSINVAKNPLGWLKWDGQYRITVGPAGENFANRRSRHFSLRIKGPPRPPNWFFDESDMAMAVYGERTGGVPMGYAQQPISPVQMTAAPDPADQVVRSVRALKEVQKVLGKDDDDEKKRIEELETELRMARHSGGGAWGGWGGGPGGPPYRQREDEDRRRREDEERRRLEEERRRREDEERRRREEEERRRLEGERHKSEEERRRVDEERRHEMQEMRQQFDGQMKEVLRQAEETRRRAEEAERKAAERERDLAGQKEREEERRRWDDQRRSDEDRRREEKERWEIQQRTERERFEQQRRDEESRRLDEQRRYDAQLAEIRKQNEVLATKISETPRETAFDKLVGNLPTFLIQAKEMFGTNRVEALAQQQQAREDARAERERARDDSNRQLTMYQEMSRMNVESIRAQSEQQQVHSRTLLELMSKNNNSGLFDSVASAMTTMVKTQTDVLSSVAKLGMGGAGQQGPSPWVDVAAGAIEAVGNIASAGIAAKFGAPPEVVRQMMGFGGGEEEPQAPPVRRPPQRPRQMPPPPQQRLPQPPREPPLPQPRVVIPRAQPRQQQPPAPQERSRQQPVAATQAQPLVADIPGMPRKIMNRVLVAAQNGEPPLVVARKLFALVELCDVHELHKGNPEAERIMTGLTTEVKIKDQVAELFAQVGVTDEEYVEAICRFYVKLIYAYVKALQSPEEEAEASASAETGGEEAGPPEGEEGEEEEEEEEEEEGEEQPEEAAEESQPPTGAEPEEGDVVEEAAPEPAEPEPEPVVAAPSVQPKPRITRKPKPALADETT